MAVLYCTDCGHVVSDKAIACPNCGCPVEEIIKEMSQNEESKQGETSEKKSIFEESCEYFKKMAQKKNEEYVAEMEEEVRVGRAKKLTLFGKVHYTQETDFLRRKEDSEKCDWYSLVCDSLIEESVSVANDYKTLIFKEYNSKTIKNYNYFTDYIEKLIEDFFNDMLLKIKKCISDNKHISRSELNEFIDDIKQEYYSKATQGEVRIVNLYGEIEKIAQQLVDRMEYDKAIGDVKKQMRGRVIGGGTNIQGALMGMASAGVANAIYGGLYEMKNIVANAKSADKRRNEFMTRLLSEEFKEILADSVKHDIALIGNVAIELLKRKEESINEFYHFNLPDYKLVKQHFFEECEQYGKDDDYTINDLKNDIRCYLSLYPTEEYIYQYILEHFGDELHELDDWAVLGNVNLNQIRQDIFEKYEKTISNSIYGEEYLRLLTEKADKLGYTVSVDEYVNERNAYIIDKACSHSIDTVEGLEKNISKLRDLKLDEAEKRIAEYEKKIAEIKDRDNYAKFLVNIDNDSIESLLSAYKNITKINTAEAKSKAEELIELIFKLVLSQRLYNDQIYFKKGIDETIIKNMLEERKNIESNFHGLQDEWDVKQYDNAIHQLSCLECKIYNVNDNIKILKEIKMDIQTVIGERAAKIRELQRNMQMIEEQLLNAKKVYAESNKESGNMITGFFVNKARSEKLAELQSEIDTLNKEYNEKRNEYENISDEENIVQSIKNRILYNINLQPVFKFMDSEAIVNSGVPKIIYYDGEKYCGFEVKITGQSQEATKCIYSFQKISSLSEKHAQIVSCDGMEFHTIFYDDIAELGEKIWRLYGDTKSKENLFLLFEGLGKEEYDKEMEQTKIKKQKQEEERIKLEEERIKREKEKIRKEQEKIIDLLVSNQCCIGLRRNGTIKMFEESLELYPHPYITSKKDTVELWEGIKSIYLSESHIIALKHDGTLKVATDLDVPYLRDWKKINQISLHGSSVLGVTYDGKEKTKPGYLRDSISTSNKIRKIYSGCNHDFAIDSCGNVYKTESYSLNYPVEKWRNIVDVVEISSAAIGLTEDGKLVAEIDRNKRFQSFVDELQALRGVKKIIGNENLMMALLETGKVYCTSYQTWRAAIKNWDDIVDIAIDEVHCVGLKSNGTVVVASDPEFTGREHEKWRNIEKIATARIHTVGLTKDGEILFSDNGYHPKK